MYELNNRAVQLSKDGKLNEAIELFMEALEADPYDSYINFNISLVYIKKEQFRKAISFLETSIELLANDDNLREIGVCYIRLNEHSRARPYLERAITEFGSSESENVMGAMFFQMSNFEEAKRHFENSTKLNSKNRDAWFNLKDTYIELGMDREAKMALYQFNILKKNEI